ncbi:MAG: S9 family peptidase [Deltaproteobacteria bacterium]|nr:MAG: S9 family peptidase [Deltaproteobacteria bacterium]
MASPKTSASLLAALLATSPAHANDDDPRIWLEEVKGERAMEWVEQQNERSTSTLTQDPSFEEIRARLLQAYDSDDRIPTVSKRGHFLYNFWRDAQHPRGVWRRTTLEEYRRDTPSWEVLLDLDALAEREAENWVWSGSTCLPPDYERCLIQLSKGGADATVVREYDIATRSFIEGGFELPEAKSRVSWIDRDTLFVATDFGQGSMTTSGYPRVVKVWSRGTPIEQAEKLFEGAEPDVAVGAYRDHTKGFERDIIYRAITFYTNETWLRDKKGALVRLEKPDSAKVSFWRDYALFELRDDWDLSGRTFKKGSLLAAPLKRWLRGRRDVQVLFEPTPTTSLTSFSGTRNHLLVNSLDNVQSRIEVLTPGKKGWSREALPGLLELGQVSASAVDPDDSDAYWLNLTGFLTPSTLSYGVIGQGQAEPLKQLPTFFRAEGLAVSQHFATSKDGTKVPYFQIAPEGLPLDGSSPTLLYGYGGFEVSLLPSYNATNGIGWIERGGVYVLANIRGGGEFGPRWHQAALKQNRHRAYEDFAAIARDLVERKVTSPEKLGTRGGSNGGLLMGNMYTLYPELFGAVVCQVPLLDMRRYHLLLAGPSWMGEYGDPEDPEQWSFIKTFSPYHNVGQAEFPPMLITTSTLDDRVHPGHARKMAHLLLERDEDVLYYENIEGGHGGAANNEQSAHMNALAFTFLWRSLSEAEQVPESTGEGESRP